jgi:hypothetical protein
MTVWILTRRSTRSSRREPVLTGVTSKISSSMAATISSSFDAHRR